MKMATEKQSCVLGKRSGFVNLQAQVCFFKNTGSIRLTAMIMIRINAALFIREAEGSAELLNYSQIPKIAQTVTNWKKGSLNRHLITDDNTTATTMSRMAQAGSLNTPPFQLRLTSRAVALAMVATVIQPR